MNAIELIKNDLRNVEQRSANALTSWANGVMDRARDAVGGRAR